ncbi:hypothetical protein ACIQXD_31085 [Streptomyces uncialis]|uniref:DUF7507 domain-containing protein n=1 Tax=Streptomyces uncialis TaxID=1048205 RepID=UPI0037F7A98C
MRGSPGRRRGLGALLCTGLVLGAQAVAIGSAAAPAYAAPATVPGTPGLPQAPTTVYAEGFENGTGQTPILLTAYTGAPPANAKYTAAPAWVDPAHCNGIILNQSGANQPACQNQNPVAMAALKFMANALGQVAGSSAPNTNHAVSAYTDGANPGANKVEFQTVNPIPLVASSRFITFSVDAAAENCNRSAPLLNFFLTGSGPDIPVTSAPINPCTDPRAQTYDVGPRPILAGSFASDSSVLFSGSAVGIKMTNANGSGLGNDHAYDNIKILDVTPQLDKEFLPASIPQGGTSTLTFTVTNTTDLAAKSGFGFTDTLPAGVTVAATPNASTTCGPGTVSATAGGSSVGLSGGVLTDGTASCTVTVDVTSTTIGAHVNQPGDVVPTGVNPPGPATITVVVPGSPTIVKAADAATFETGQTINYTYTVTNTASSTLTNLVLTDNGPGTPTVTCAATTLAAGASTTCTASYTAATADAVTGTITNSATVTGTVDGQPVNGASNQVVIPLRSLTVTKAAQQDEYSGAGQTIDYVFTVTNNGRVPLTNISVTDNGPGTPTVTCPAGPLAPGDSVDCTAVHTTTATDVSNGNVTNNATASGTAPDGETTDDQSNTVIVPYVPPVLVDLAVKKTGPATVGPGGSVSYTITVTNNGPGDSSGYTVSDVIPDGLTGASTGTPGCGIGSGTLTCTGDSLANGASTTITLTGTVGQGATGIVNTVTVTGEDEDPDPGNNTDTFTTNVPSVSIVKKQDGRSTVQPGDDVRYTITVRNNGGATVDASFSDDLSDLLDDAAYNDDATAGTGEVRFSAPDLEWNGTLAPGQTATITFSVTIDSRPFGDLRLDNTVVSDTPGNNCPQGGTDPRCTTHGTVKVKDKDKTARPGPQGQTRPGVRQERPVDARPIDTPSMLG